MPAARLDPSPVRCSLQTDRQTDRASLLLVEASAVSLRSLPAELREQHRLFYLTIPFPLPEFLEGAWRGSSLFSLKPNLHVEIKTFRKGLATLIV